MKKLIFPAIALITLWTSVEPVWALDDTATSSTSLSDMAGPEHLSDLGMHINPQIGVSSFEYSGTSASGEKAKLSGGATVEFGEGARKLETGVLLLQTGSTANLGSAGTEQINSSYLTLPMMAKLRILNMQSQSWYLKLGALTAFQVSSSDRANTNPFDILGAAGLGGRFKFTRTADFIVEATYNRGLMEAVRSSSTNSYNQGVLIMAGLSFKI